MQNMDYKANQRIKLLTITQHRRNDWITCTQKIYDKNSYIKYNISDDSNVAKKDSWMTCPVWVLYEEIKYDIVHTNNIWLKHE